VRFAYAIQSLLLARFWRHPPPAELRVGRHTRA
jgi:hypothetical protein